MSIISILLMIFTIILSLYPSGMSYHNLLDLPSILFIVVPCFAASFNVSSISHTFKAFLYLIWPSEKFHIDNGILIKIYSISSFVAIGAGFIFTLIGILSILPLLGGDLTVLGRSLAVSIIPLIYGLIVKYLFLGPTISRLRT